MIHRPSPRFRVSNFRCEKPEMELSGNGGGAEVEKKERQDKWFEFRPPSPHRKKTCTRASEIELLTNNGLWWPSFQNPDLIPFPEMEILKSSRVPFDKEDFKKETP